MKEQDLFGARVLFEMLVNETQFRALSAGYECGHFRNEQLATVLFNALPDFALSYSEVESVNKYNMVSKLAKAARLVYQTDKYGKRGEFGELMLHVVMREFFDTIPAVSKLYYKDAPNDTVKGFDAVHVVVAQDGLELWVGEAKFYGSVRDAISDTVAELQKHTQPDYLRNEFIAICNKIDPRWPYANQLERLLDKNISLDFIFRRMRIPVLLTYDSTVVQTYRQVTEEYRLAFVEEVSAYHNSFRSNPLPRQVDIVLILIPLESKQQLVEALHSKLEALQAL